MVDHTIIKVLSSKMGIPSSWFYLKDTIFNSEDGHIKGATTQIKDENISFTTNLKEKKKKMSWSRDYANIEVLSLSSTQERFNKL